VPVAGLICLSIRSPMVRLMDWGLRMMLVLTPMLDDQAGGSLFVAKM
jgi:hypothetical protein